MAKPGRMPRFEAKHDNGSVVVAFYCELCQRAAYSQPISPLDSSLQQVGREAVGGLIRHIPVVGETVADTLVGPETQGSSSEAFGALVQNVSKEFASEVISKIPLIGEQMAQNLASGSAALTPQQVEAAWQQVEPSFQECPQCHKIVCSDDFDAGSGLCSADRAALPVQAAAPTVYPASAVQESAAVAHCPSDGTLAPAGTKFCPNCGTAMTQPGTVTICAQCGAQSSGAKFCPNCGAKLESAPPAPPTHCPNCGAENKGSRFCPNCGTKLI